MTNRIIDILGTNHLIHEGSPDQGNYGISPYVTYDGIGNYSHNKSGNLKGIDGLTAGGWFMDTGGADTLMGVWVFPANQCWRLFVSVSVPTFTVSSTGSDTIGIASVAIVSNQWNFIVGKFDPANSELAIFLNGIKYSNFSAPSQLFNSTAGFAIGGDPNGNNLSIGRASNCFMCESAVSDSQINLIHSMSKHLYGK